MKVQSQFIEMFGNPVTNPKGWKTSKIKDVAPESPSKESVDGRVWLLNLDMIESNTGKVIEKVYEDSENALSVQPFDEGNVLFSKLRPYLNKVVIPDEPGLATTELVPLRPKGDILNKIFFSHLLRGDQFVNFANDIAGGTKMPRMPLSELRKFECILPPMEEQMKFVAIAELADKSKFVGFKSQFIEMFGGGNWPQKTLGEVGSFTRGGGFQKSDFVEHGIPCIHYGQIHTKFGPFITSHITEISSDLESKTKFASKGDLVIAITSEDTEGSCKSTAWLGDYPVAVGGHAAIYKHSMNPLYMSFFFKSTLFNHAKIEYVHGTKVFEIKPDDIAKILVPCPPMSLQNQFSAIAQQADKSKFVAFKSQFIEMFGNNVSKKKISDVCDVRGGSTPTRTTKEFWNNGTISWFTVEDIYEQGRYITETKQHITKLATKKCFIYPVDTVLICCTASVGEYAITKKEMASNQQFNGMMIKDKSELHPEYLLYVASTLKEDLLRQAGKTTINFVSRSKLENIEIPVPPYSEQLGFVSVYRQADKSKYYYQIA